MATFVPFQSFIEALAEKKHDLGSDQLKVALTNVAPNAATHTKLSDITEITYTNISAREVTTSSSEQTTGTYKLICADLELTATGDVGPFRYPVLYNDDSTDDLLIAYWDRGNSITLMNGEKIDLDFDGTNGVVKIAPV
jgi:hypothetical protein